MDKPIIERDVVLIGKDENGNDTFDLPVTRLANIESDAEVKENPDSKDYFPVIDMEDNGKMKKTSSGGILAPLSDHIGDSTKHMTAEERKLWNGKANGDHNHDGRYYTKTETDNKLTSKSDKSHTHSASDISGLPTSLPASGGNADTVGGKRAEDFAATVHTHDDRYYTETETDNKLKEKADKNHTHSAATDSKAGFMSPEDKKKLDGLNGGLKSVQSVTLGSEYIYPTFTVPEDSEYYVMLFRVGSRCIFAGFYRTDEQANINTGGIGIRIYEPEDADSNYSDGDYICVNREADKLRISAYQYSATQGYGGASDAKMRGGGIIQLVFF